MKIILISLITIMSLYAEDISISGIYKGFAKNKIKNNISIEIENIQQETLSDYKDIFPTTGGKRVMLYFDTKGDSKANYCGYMYKNVMVLNKESTSGFYNVHIGYIPIVNKDNKTHITIPKEYIKEDIIKIWTYKMH